MASFGTSENGSDATLCANNCGFYGSPENHALCSVCYAAFLEENPTSISTRTGEDSGEQECSDDIVRSRNLFSELTGVNDDEEPNLVTGRSSPSAPESSATSGSVAGLNPAAKTKSRCMVCKKKVGLLGFNCRCGGSFCGRHKYPEEHSCNVDYQAIGREILSKQIVECKADKLEFRV